MKNKLFVLALALMMALPVFGLAADLTTTEDTQTTPAAATPAGGQFGRRWNQETPAATVAPQTGFVDADEDGVCDNCGQAQGQNPDAPGYVDENKDGVCDHYGTDEAGQGRANTNRSRANTNQARGNANQGRGNTNQGRMNDQRMGGNRRSAQGQNQGGNYVDENNDGVCDHMNQAGTQQGQGRNSKPGNHRNAAPGRNRR